MNTCRIDRNGDVGTASKVAAASVVVDNDDNVEDEEIMNITSNMNKKNKKDDHDTNFHENNNCNNSNTDDNDDHAHVHFGSLPGSHGDAQLHQLRPSSPPPPRPVSPPATLSRESSPVMMNFNAKDLRGNLMREQHDRDPMFYYEVVQVLGVGSMGSVIKVKKRVQTVGGSARKSMQEIYQRQKWEKQCLSIPIVGNLFKYCISGRQDDPNSSSSNRNILVDPTSSANTNNNSPMNNNVNNNDNGGGDPSSPTDGGSKYMYAMKSIHLDRISNVDFAQELRNEIGILKKLDHPHIVRPIETFELRNQIFIVMETCSGGDLYTRDPYTETEAARIVSCILSAISYMHSRNIAHRDLKYENILFVDKSPQAVVKLIDFGLSKTYSNEQQNLTEGVGTIYTMAPEVIKGNYTKQADLWSVGVIAYMLLSSQMPFYGRKRRHIIELVLSCQYNFNGRRWRHISNQAKSFVEDLLVKDPNERLSADQAYASAWLHRRNHATVRNPDVNEETGIQQSMINYIDYSRLKKMALMIVAHKSTCEDIGILRKVFDKYDQSKSGDLSLHDFKNSPLATVYSSKQIKRLFNAMDLDGTGRIRYTEFLAATIEFQGTIPEEMIAEAFDRLDSDDSGYISENNLKDILGNDFPPEEIHSIMTELSNTLSDTKKISYPEFLSLMQQKSNNNTDFNDANDNDDNGSERKRIMSNSDSMSDISDADDSSISVETSLRRTLFLEAKNEHLKFLEEAKNTNPNSEKHVFFKESVTFIPREDSV